MKYAFLSNPAWPGWFKVMKTQQNTINMAPYQHLSPFKDYKIEFMSPHTDVVVKAGWYEAKDVESLRKELKLPKAGE